MSDTRVTLSPGLAQFADERPIVKVIVDISEPMAMLTAGLCEISPENLIDDKNIDYIGTILVDSVASPFPGNPGRSRISTFFHSSVKDKVDELADQIKEIISHELRSAEKASEDMLKQPIYPAKDMNTILSKCGNLMTLSYRLGAEQENPAVDDPYLGVDPAVRKVYEEADEETAAELEEEIVIIE